MLTWLHAEVAIRVVKVRESSALAIRALARVERRRRIQECIDKRIRFSGAVDRRRIAAGLCDFLPCFEKVISIASAFFQGETRSHTHTRLCLCTFTLYIFFHVGIRY